MPPAFKALATADSAEFEKLVQKLWNFKLKIEDSHLRVFAYRNYPDIEKIQDAINNSNKKANKKDLYIYVLANRKLNNNMQSPAEIEVFKWSDQGIEETITDSKGQPVKLKRHILPLEKTG